MLLLSDSFEFFVGKDGYVRWEGDLAKGVVEIGGSVGMDNSGRRI